MVRMPRPPFDSANAALRKRLIKWGLDRARYAQPNTPRYSIISAVYNVEEYLTDYFTSIARQPLFSTAVEVIMVDDGSTDRSAEVIGLWQRRYPHSIRYVRKENGGQASARNAGIPLARGEWLTFIDPDDFVSPRYFGEITRFINRYGSDRLSLIAANMIYWVDAERRFKDDHPLKFRFQNGDRLFNALDLGEHIQLSVNSVFVRRRIVEDIGLRFDPRVVPTFEDGHFVGRYILGASNTKVGFCAGARYCYRKRGNSSSAVDTAWLKPQRYDEVLRFGYRDLFDSAQRMRGHIPRWVQRTVFYDLGWFFNRIVDAPATTRFLSQDQRAIFENHLKMLMDQIDPEVIENFRHRGVSALHKVGILGLFKKQSVNSNVCVVEHYDSVKESVLLKYFYFGQEPSEEVVLDGDRVFPTDGKVRVHYFMDHEFARERRVWVDLAGATGISLLINGSPAAFSLYSAQNKGDMPTQLVRNAFRPKRLDEADFPVRVMALRRLAQWPGARHRYRNAWLFMDRDVQADDNAEHLYRWVREHHPQVNAFFVLRKTSHDWPRLKRDGFRLLEFGSKAHKFALLNAHHVISSHADDYVHSYLGGRKFSDLLSYRFTFLQHGVISVDLSDWLNRQPISLFITSTEDEYRSIAGSCNRYRFTRREVALTGLPRHDKLLRDVTVPEKLILIAPTWRQSIVGPRTGRGNARSDNQGFSRTDFATKWKRLLHSSPLLEAARKHGYRIAFFPHANVQPYVAWFEVPEEISVWTHDHGISVQSILQRTELLITDYSSLAFEMAVLKRPVIYYQFDADQIFNGSHIYAKGYFDYSKDGFGPVCSTEEDVVTSVGRILAQADVADPIYASRMESTIRYRDGQNCRRVFERIVALDSAAPVATNGELFSRDVAVSLAAE